MDFQQLHKQKGYLGECIREVEDAQSAMMTGPQVEAQLRSQVAQLEERIKEENKALQSGMLLRPQLDARRAEIRPSLQVSS